MKLFAASKIKSLQNQRVASTNVKDERDLETLVGKENPANPHDQSYNERNQKELEKEEPRTKESDNDRFQRKKREETR